VCDGHGLHGHLVSHYVKKLLPSLFLIFMEFNYLENITAELKGTDTTNKLLV
jgi:hypothetical protein